MFRVKSFTCQRNIERWDDKCKREAKALPKEKRQQFLDLMHKSYTIKEAYTECGISFDEANGIMMLNIAEVLYLRSESV
jgi:hypothetical protein